MSKTRKKIHRNRSNKSIGVKSQKGGVLFKIHPGDFKELNHLGLRGTVGEGISCVGCTMNQLRFPVSLVNKATRFANRGSGMPWEIIQDAITDEEGKINQPDVQMWSWAALKGSNPQTLSVNSVLWGILGKNQDNMQSIKMTQTALEGIFQTLEYGTAALLGMLWMERNQDGTQFAHITVIAKSYNGTPYLIEAQDVGFQGYYRGMDNIIARYFAKQAQVGNFLTYNNSEPKLVRGTWTLQNEPVLNLEPEKSSPEALDTSRTQSIPELTIQRSFTDPTTRHQQSQHQGLFASETPSHQQPQHQGLFASKTPSYPTPVWPQPQQQQLEYPNPYFLAPYLFPDQKGVFCDICKEQNLTGSYHRGQEDACFNCYRQNRGNINPLGLQWQGPLPGMTHSCDACPATNLQEIHRNPSRDIDFCKECFVGNKPLREKKRGGNRTNKKKRKSKGTRKK